MAGIAVVPLEVDVVPADVAMAEFEKAVPPAHTATVELDEVDAPCSQLVDEVPAPQQS